MSEVLGSGDVSLSSFQVEHCNGAPSKETFFDAFEDTGIEFVDVDESVERYWQNDHDTAVIKVCEGTSFEKMALLAAAIAEVHPDEIDILWTWNGDAVYRLWWD